MLANDHSQGSTLINKISKIKRHRIFHDFVWPADLQEFSRYNLVYGWNGSGKTTLAYLFAGLEKPVNITEGEIEFIIRGDRVSGSALEDTPGLPALRVFTRDIVASSVFTDGSGLNPIYYFGKKSVDDQKRLEELRKERGQADNVLTVAQSTKEKCSKELVNYCTDQAKAIKMALTGPGSEYNNYERPQFQRSCNGLANSGGPLPVLSADQKRQSIQKKDAQVRQAIPKLHLDIPALATITETVAGMLETTVISQVIARLTEEPLEAEWVKEGLKFHRDEDHPITCKFCGSVLTEERLTALEGHFNDKYNQFITDIEVTTTAIEGHIRVLTDFPTPQPAVFYEHLVPQYHTARELLATALADTIAYLSALRSSLFSKRTSLFEPLALDEYLIDTDATADLTVTKRLAAVNQVIDFHNRYTTDHVRIKRDARLALEQCLVAEAYPRYKELCEALATANGEEAEAKGQLQQLGETITSLEQSLIEHRTPAEELNSELGSFLGRSDLVLSVESTGYKIMRRGVPASHLSEGEKTAIVFLYFLKSLQDKSFDLKRGVVVIDDPISSLDNSALFSAFGFMKERTHEAGQLFILTHNFSFFQQVKNWFKYINKSARRFFMLTRSCCPAGNTVEIRCLSKFLEHNESEYHYLFKQVHDASMQAASPDNLEIFYPLPNMARRLLEAFLAFRYPHVVSETALHTIVKNLECTDAQKAQIIRFLNVLSHFDRIPHVEQDLSMLGETPQVLREILALMKSEDPLHYDRMLQCVTE